MKTEAQTARSSRTILAETEHYTIFCERHTNGLLVFVASLAEGVAVRTAELPHTSPQNCLFYGEMLYFHTGARLGRLEPAALLQGREEQALVWLDLYPQKLKGSEPGGYYYPMIEQRLYPSRSGGHLVLWSHYHEYDPAAVDEDLLYHCDRFRIIQTEPFRILEVLTEESPLFPQFMRDAEERYPSELQ